MLIEPLMELNEFNILKYALNTKKTPLLAVGLTDEQRLHIIYALSSILDKNVLYITENEAKAKKAYEDLTFFTDRADNFPAEEIMLYGVEAKSNEISSKRMALLEKLLYRDKLIVTASIDALLGRLDSPEKYKAYLKLLKTGDNIDLINFANDLSSMGYERVDIIEGKGQFSLRGGIIDIFSPGEEKPFRIELFDDEIDSIRIFDIASQRTEKVADSIRIFPAREIMVTPEIKKNLAAQILKETKSYVNKVKDSPDKDKIISNIQSKMQEYAEGIENTDNYEYLELFKNYIYGKDTSLIEYFNDPIIVFDEPERIREHAQNLSFEFKEGFKMMLERGGVLPGQSALMLDYEDILKKVQNSNTIIFSTFMRSLSSLKVKDMVSFTTRPMQSFHSNIDLLLEQLEMLRKLDYRIVILSGSKQRGMLLRDRIVRSGLSCDYAENKNVRLNPGQIIIMPGTISRGFEYTDIKFSLINDEEIFGAAKKKRKIISTNPENRIKNYTDLKSGDFVVHVNHGIGRFIGINKMKINGTLRDYLYIQYAGTDKLFIPTDQLDMIQKYVGSDEAKPKLNKLGGGEWVRTKAKVKESLKDIARELIKLYAERNSAKGFIYPEDTVWQSEFEDRFIYEETADQLKAIDEVKSDMQSEKVMDRLLCGDVGYGKTEVAIRAAFKAASCGKQVAVLCPTTILAEQHFNTFSKRFRDFPLRVDMLSRFRTREQQRKTIKDIKDGLVDVIIGTHRILQKDIAYKDLGLLIVDEEQRFGVKHKEEIKKIKMNVDVLTLTATPIPRTLYMSLLKIRDMSILENPPEERYPVQTYVTEYNDSLIKDAIMREIGRGGQVYFVYNRVAGIQNMFAYLQELMPDARIAVGHGQMSERQLENVMIKFYEGEYDVLLCTTIIETGLDIPNVNTIIIYDADKFGLSQLYQLRGRVGRSNRLAYAYFTYRKDKVLTEEAEKRLKAIKEFTEFGSGFKLAMRDLEIRGAGNILGAEQHGHMIAVGYDMYMKLMDEAIHELKGEILPQDSDVTIDLNVNAYIDSSYIKIEELRLEMYKKIASIENENDAIDISDELLDRYGDIPPETQSLIYIALIKTMAHEYGIISIKQDDDVLTLYSKNPVNITEGLANLYRGRLIYVNDDKPYIKFKVSKKSAEMLKELKKFLSDMKKADLPKSLALQHS